MRSIIPGFLGLLSCLPGVCQQSGEVKYTSSLSPKEMFQTWCAPCHGTDGKGGGPAAASLKHPPSDLTQISQKNAGKFPASRVHDYIDGTAAAAAHGSREMPV